MASFGFKYEDEKTAYSLMIVPNELNNLMSDTEKAIRKYYKIGDEYEMYHLNIGDCVLAVMNAGSNFWTAMNLSAQKNTSIFVHKYPLKEFHTKLFVYLTTVISKDETERNEVENIIKKLISFENNDIIQYSTIKESFWKLEIQYNVTIWHSESNILYMFNSFKDFLNFELYQLVEKKLTLKKCKHCGKYFIPRTRTDEIYCNFPGADGEKCKTKAEKLRRKKRDESKPLTKIENNIRTTLLNRTKATTISDEEKKERFKLYSKFLDEKQEIKEKLKNKIITNEEYEKWLTNYKY